MKILVGYNGGEVGELALSLARDYAKTNNGFVYILTSLEGGASEKPSDIVGAEKALEFARQSKATLLFKGARTIVTDQNSPLAYNTTGTPALAAART